MAERALSFLPLNPRPPKPRSHGLTEVRGPYYTPMGKRYLEDLLETMGESIDLLKFAGGSFALMPRTAVEEIIALAHRYHVRVSTGGFLERLLVYGPDSVVQAVRECRDLGFDVVEISTGFVALDTDDWIRLIERVRRKGLEARAEVGIQFGAGGGTSTAELAALSTRDPELVLKAAERLLEAGSERILLESEGITENVVQWRTEVATEAAQRLGLERVIFEAADPEVFAWYVQMFGPQVNLFVDHSQVIQLEALRTGLWGPNRLWGRIASFSEE